MCCSRLYAHRRSYKPLLKKAGLPDIRLYDLRHTFATLMFENSEQLKLVSEMLGHASVKQTADTYTHVSPVGGPEKRLDELKRIIEDSRKDDKRVPEVVFVDDKPKPSASRYR